MYTFTPKHALQYSTVVYKSQSWAAYCYPSHLYYPRQSLENSGVRISKSSLRPYPGDAGHHSGVLAHPRGHSLIRCKGLKGPGLEHERLLSN